MFAFAFMSPKMQEALVRQEQVHEKRRYEQYLKAAQPWSDDIRYQDTLVIRAETWLYRPLFPRVKAGTHRSENRGTRFGEWTYRNVTLPAGHALDIWRSRRPGKVYFTDDIVIPQICTHEHGQLKVWMSLTPAEVISQRAGVRFACGHVVVGGLGMGWALRKIAQRKQVERITLIERSSDLLDWYGTKMVRKIEQETGRKIRVICGDVFVEAPKLANPDVRAVLDVWAYYGDAWKDPKLQKLRGVMPCWAWGEVRYTGR
jgi:hypothetical protein